MYLHLAILAFISSKIHEFPWIHCYVYALKNYVLGLHELNTGILALYLRFQYLSLCPEKLSYVCIISHLVSSGKSKMTIIT